MVWEIVCHNTDGSSHKSYFGTETQWVNFNKSLVCLPCSLSMILAYATKPHAKFKHIWQIITKNLASTRFHEIVRKERITIATLTAVPFKIQNKQKTNVEPKQIIRRNKRTHFRCCGVLYLLGTYSKFTCCGLYLQGKRTCTYNAFHMLRRPLPIWYIYRSKGADTLFSWMKTSHTAAAVLCLQR